MSKNSPGTLAPSGTMMAMLMTLALATPQLAHAEEQPATKPDVQLSQDGERSAGPPVGDNIFTGDWVTLGLGLGYRPSYEGSDDYNFGPAPLVQGSVAGFDFGARGPGLYVDVVRDGDSDSKIKIVAGPQLLVRLDRTSQIKDDAVELLGERETGIELGFTAGLAFEELLNPFDTLTVSVDAGWDVAGAHRGQVVSPSISYTTPLSRAIFANLSLSADHVDDNYAATYYSIDNADSVASGLPEFTATSGWKSAGAFLVAGYDLSGNALDGGLSLFALGNYSSLLGDAKNTPITSVRGDADQWFVGAGVAYSF